MNFLRTWKTGNDSKWTEVTSFYWQISSCKSNEIAWWEIESWNHFKTCKFMRMRYSINYRYLERDFDSETTVQKSNTLFALFAPLRTDQSNISLTCKQYKCLNVSSSPMMWVGIKTVNKNLSTKFKIWQPLISYSNI